MSFQGVVQSRTQNPQTSSSTSRFAPRSFSIPEPQRPQTQEEIENEAFEQDKFEASRLQLKEKYGTIAPAEQGRLGILQAKMDSFWVQRMERATPQPNLLDIMIRNAQTTSATESAAPVQTKLTIGQPNDQYEQEADRVAAQVMTMPNPTAQVQRQPQNPAPEELSEKAPALQSKPIAASITPLVQRQELPEEELSVQRVADGVPQVQPDLESRLNASQSSGSPLPDDVRGFMEPRFGADFSQVRVHTGSDAVQMNQELGAQAFTHGSHIYYGAGKAPATDELTGHELTHVVQQMQGQQRDIKIPDAACGKQSVEHEVENRLTQAQGHMIQKQRDLPAHQAGMDEGGDAQGDFASVGGTAWCLAMTSIGLDNVAMNSVVTFFQRFYPMAYDHLIAYLSGTGDRPYDEPIGDLFNQNPRVAERISRYIRIDGSRAGIWFSDNPDTAPIRQVDYDLEDWRLALGNIDEVQWEILGEPDEEGFAEVRISIRDPYVWSPQDERFTDCFHELFERERTEGHAEVFEAWGIGDVRLQVAEPEPSR